MSISEPRADDARNHRLVLAVLPGLMAGIFLSALDVTVMSTSLKTIADGLGGLDLLAWATTAFLVTETVSGPIYGRLADIYGRKSLYLIAIVLFLIGSLTCAFAQSMYQLAAFRAIQGLGAGGLVTLPYTISADIMAPRDRARYQGYFLAVWVSASVLGPAVGGLFAGASSFLGIAGWRWIFLVNLPIGLVALAVIVKALNVKHYRQTTKVDYWGGVTILVAVAPILMLFESGRDWGWGSPLFVACLVIGLLGLSIFLVVQRRAGDAALIPLRLFRVQTYRISVLIAATVGVGMFGAISLVPLYLQLVRGAKPILSGLIMLPMMLGVIIATIASGAIISRRGRYKMLPVVGAAVTTVGMVGFGFVGVDTPMWVPVLLVVLFGIGVGSCTQAITMAAQNAVPARDTSAATASLTFIRQMASALGVALFLSLMFGTLHGSIASALRRATTDQDFAAAIHDPAVAETPSNAPLFDFLNGARRIPSDSSFLDAMDQALARPFREGFASSINLVFLLGAGIMVLTCALALRMKEVPLRDRSVSQLLAEEAGDAERA
ncbi:MULTISPECIES: MDR family MFS transporter [unclassified Nocardia]|uniref:MDR family MFS transporter n=1 Tax=unclassified Nocardia TaxID=2637762 RepID=UPI001CE4B0B0|nr:MULTISPECIES: MDR family MFS transporter [unclassified Nocardia]